MNDPILYGPDNKPLPPSGKANSAKKPEKSKPRKRAEKDAKNPRRGWLLRAGIWALSGTVTLVGLAAGVLTFLPRVTVSVSDPVDASNPLSSSITVTNTGYIPLYSVVPHICLGGVSYGKEARPPQKWNYGVSCLPSMVRWETKEMKVDDKKTVALDEQLNIRGEFSAADIAVAVDYELPLPWIHIKRRKFFPMTAVRQTNGNFYWYSKPED